MEAAGLTKVKGEIDGIGVLDAVEHGLTLPPRGLLVPVEVSQLAGVVTQLRVFCVTVVTGARGAGLHAVVLRCGTADVGRLNRAVKGHVLKLGHAATGNAVFVIAGVHRGPDQKGKVQMKGEHQGQE